MRRLLEKRSSVGDMGEKTRVSFHRSLRLQCLRCPCSHLYTRIRFVMLAYFGSKVTGVAGVSGQKRVFTSSSKSSSGVVWKHHAGESSAKYVPHVPESQNGVSGEVIAKMRRLREEAPKTFTARRLSNNFNLSKTTVNAVAPEVRHQKKVCEGCFAHMSWLCVPFLGVRT